MVAFVDETLVNEDHHAKDKEMSDKELEEIQDHLLADSSDENLTNKKKVSDQELRYIQDGLLADCSDDSGEDEEGETLN